MDFFHHKDLGNHLLQYCPKVVKHPVYSGKYGTWILPAELSAEWNIQLCLQHNKSKL